LAALHFVLVPESDAAVLVPLNSVWKYQKGTNEASAPVAAWRGLSFNDSVWSAGVMPFHYGENFTGGTLFGDMRNNYGSIFLRRTFVVTDLASVGGLDLIATCDDGFIVWINGQPVQRYNLADNKGAYTDLADTAVAEPVAQIRYFLPDHRNYLVQGTNLIAVQLFNNTLASSDIQLNLQLVAVDPDSIPPTLGSFSPAAGNVGALSQVTLQFSEPVLGVDEGDLLLNGAMAVSVTAVSGSAYTFNYDPQPFGSIAVTWNPNHGIVDLARPGNAFDAGAAGTWQYNVVDVTVPTVASLTPPADRTVRLLSQIEVSFSEGVSGIDASDLMVNGVPATSVTGFGSGPYMFQFPTVISGTVQLSWAPGHGIQDLAVSPNAFAGGSWSYTVDPGAIVGDLVINEFLAANENGLLDEDAEAQDWIEIYNRGSSGVNLGGWALTDDARVPGQWTFPAITLGPQQYLIVFASGKDRKPTTPGSRLHTNFKLSAAGEYLALYTFESPRVAVDELTPNYPAQRNDYSYARVAGTNVWRYFRTPTPGAANGTSAIEGVTPEVHFSVMRGFFNTAFNLTLASDMSDAVIRYTLDGTPPTEIGGLLYSAPLLVDRTRMVRAAAFGPNRIPSEIKTHTYFFNLSAAVRSLPAISIVTASNSLFGPTGIMETSPRNTTKHGIAWERPVSVEYIQPWDNGGFDIDAGLRIQGGGYVRDRYDPNGSLPFSKYSFRLYFRGDYGASKLEFPLVPGSPVEVFDKIVLRAGMNDHSNPFILDELVRRLYADMGQVSSRGNLTTFFLNGVYKGYYNPCERIDPDFLRSWHGGGEDWDVIAQFGEIQEGDDIAWNALRNFVSSTDLSVNAAYQDAALRLDVSNFVDYLLVNIYPAMGDWPHNNWRAARERVPGSRFRYYVWDAEWSFGFSNPVTHNTFSNELNGTTEIATFYKKLRANAEFRLLFADRIQKHFFNAGALTDARVLARFTQLRTNMAGILPGMNPGIQTSWVPQRRNIIMQHFNTQGLLASSNAPAFSQHGGKVRRGFDFTISAPSGTIYFTTNNTDPRVMFSGAISADAIVYGGTPVRLNTSTLVKARTLNGGNWSALTEAEFSVAEVGLPIRITEIMYNPQGGDAYEFIELYNAGSTTVDLGLMRFVGVDFQFPEDATIAPGATQVFSSDDDPSAFASRYPGVVVAGRFGGSLSNGGEKVALVDANGNEIVAVTYGDQNGWSKEADGSGYSLEIMDADADPNAPANWRSSTQPGGSPGALTTAPSPSTPILINEVMAENLTAVPNGGAFPDWAELFNSSSQAVNLNGWQLADEGSQFVFPAGTSLAPGGYLVVWCDTNTASPGLHTGFPLGRSGDSVFLYDPSSNRVDAVSFGLQIADRTMGRVAGEWKLTQPTPNAANVPIPIGGQSSLRLNEWLANSVPGSDDWIELYNTDATTPVSLNGIGFTTSSGAAFQVRSLSFISPGGHEALEADENPGADHIGFKLPAEVTLLVLYDDSGVEVDRASYASQIQGVSQGRLPDGATNIVSFPATPSPGAANFIANYSGPVLNEVLARDTSATANAEGRFVDWVELFNPGATAFDLSGMRLSDDRDSAGAWIFPTGTTVPGNGYLVVWFDGERPASVASAAELNTGRALDGQSGGVYLFNSQGQIVDSVEYGFQVADLSLGRSGGAWKLLANPTFGTANSAPASLGLSTNLRLNEWMAEPLSGNDWFEIYNSDALPVELGGLYLSDDPSIVGAMRNRIPALSFIAGRGWAKWDADGDPGQGAHHVNFSLNRLGQTLRLYNTGGGVIDGIDFGPQSAGASSGRLSDGQTNVVQFSTTPTPESSNYLPLPNVVINEVLSHTDPPLEDAVELANFSGAPVDIGGWYLSDDPANLRKFQIPAGTVLQAGSYKVYYDVDLNGGMGSLVPFDLNSARGDAVHLTETNGIGGLTGYRAVAEFGPSANGVSFGRYATSVGIDFVPMSRHTFGVGTPSSVPEFRTGGGVANSYPLVGPIVLSEIMYLPVATVGTNAVEIAEEEYVELQNISSSPVQLFDPAHPTNTWRIGDGIEFTFPADVTLPSQTFLLVVNFDPVIDAATASAFRTKYGVPGQVPLYGPFRSRLANEGESVALFKPDPPQTRGPDIGLVPYVLVERVAYSSSSPWPLDANGAGKSLQRVNGTEYGNDPLNWNAVAPSAGLANVIAPALDTDGDGMPDNWEIAYDLDKSDPADAGLDADGDGLSNRNEFLSGTSPVDPASGLRLEAHRAGSGGVLLRFTAVSGRGYTLQYRDSMSGGGWQKLADTPADTGMRELELTDVPGSGASERFYRLVTPIVP
jgi:hypothetical protein